MKKSLLSLMMLCFAFFGVARAQVTTVEIGDGTTAGYNTPIGTYYNYSITEQLYTAAEIGTAGTISSISFNYANSAAKDFPIEVYMQNVDAEDLSTGISLAEAELVFNGTLSVTEAGWVTIDLDTPFVFDGSSNLLIGVNKGYVYWFSGSTWYYTAVDNMARYTQSDSAGPYDTSTVPGYATTNRPNIRIAITPASGPICSRPDALEVFDVDDPAHQFSFGIVGGSGLFNIELKEGDGEFALVEENYEDDFVTLTGLTQLTAYQVRVQSVCDDGGLSGWRILSFTTTEACPAPTELTIDEETSTSATLSWRENGTASSWQIDLNGQIITAPTNPFTVTLVPETVYTAKVRAYCDEIDQSAWSNSVNLYPTNKLVVGEAETTSSYLPTYIFYKQSLSQQIYTPAELGNDAAAFLSVDFYCTQDNTYERQFDIYMVSTAKSSFENTTDWITVTASDLVYSGTVTLTQGWNSFVFDTPFVYDGMSNVALIVDAGATNYQSGPAFYVYSTENEETQSIRVYSDGTDYDPFAPTAYTGTLMSEKNHIRILTGEPPTCIRPSAFTASEVTNHTAKLTWDSEATSWELMVNQNEPITVTTKSYTLTGLAPETTYTVMVRANCGDGDVSDWSTTTFTTEIACPVPTDLEVSNITPVSAKIGWNSNNDNFELWYRVKPEGAVGFEDGTLGDWTTIDADDDGSAWFVWTSSEMVVGHNGSTYVATSASYANAALTPDNYLVSPQITLGGSLTFWACAQDAAYPSEHFGVAVSTTGNTDDADFTTIVEYDMTAKVLGTWYQYTVDLSAYSGQGYVAIRHFDCTDWFRLNVDDVQIFQPGEEEPQWTVVSSVTNPYTLTNLSSETTYEVQVRSLCGEEDGVSEWATTEFVTVSACATPIDLEANNIRPNSAILNWSNYQSSYNVMYKPMGQTLLSTDFDDSSFGGWTTIEADGDTLNWVLASNVAGIYHSTGVDVSGQGHNGSLDFVISGSYSNYLGEALTPDNYLVSPQIPLGGTIAFWAQAQDASYAAEHFGVAVSTLGNTSARDFTTIAEWTLTAKGEGVMTNPGTTRSGKRDGGNWYQFTADLSAYSGQGYVAIRHFNCTDQFLINVDDITITGPADADWTSVTVNKNSCAITGLEPNTEYMWMVQGVTNSCEQGATEWSSTTTFTTPAEGAEVIQTEELVSGVNWFSINVDITLADLQNALLQAFPDAAITIKGNKGATSYKPNMHRWVGQLGTSSVPFTLDQLYLISVPGETVINLEGVAVNPTTLPITIKKGANWIAFPPCFDMTLDEAFAGFAANGDVIKGQNGSARRVGSRWIGQLTELVPGQGYIYTSNVNEDRTLIFNNRK